MRLELGGGEKKHMEKSNPREMILSKNEKVGSQQRSIVKTKLEVQESLPFHYFIESSNNCKADAFIIPILQWRK